MSLTYSHCSNCNQPQTNSSGLSETSKNDLRRQVNLIRELTAIFLEDTQMHPTFIQGHQQILNSCDRIMQITERN